MEQNLEIKKMNLLQAIAMVFSGMVGCGLLFLPSEMACCGVWGLGSWVLGSIMAYCVFLSFIGVNNYYFESLKTKKFPIMLDFLRLGYTDDLAFLLLFGHFIAMSMTCAVTALAFSHYFSQLFPSVMLYINYQFVASGALLLMFAINIISFGAANSINFWLSCIKTLFFLLISILGMSYFSTYNPYVPSSKFILSGASTTMFAFMGLEFGILAAGSIEKPRTNVIKATKYGLFISALIFIGVYCAALFIVPNLSKTKTPIYDCAITIFGPIGAQVIGVVSLLSCLTGINGRLIVQGNALRDLSKAKIFIKCFESETAQGFAWIGACFSLIISFFVVWSPWSLDLTNFIIVLVGLLYCSIVALNIMVNGMSFISLLAIFSCIIMLWNIQIITVLQIMLVYFIGFLTKRLSGLANKKNRGKG